MAKKSERWKEAKQKRDSEPFVLLPMSVLNSHAYIECRPHSRMLLFDLVAQYRGNNNGDLSACWKFMRPRGWRSEATLAKAKQELLRVELIVETRKGARPNKASLYAVTFYSLDNCGGKLEMSPRVFPRGAYKLLDPSPPLMVKNTSLTSPAVVAPP